MCIDLTAITKKNITVGSTAISVILDLVTVLVKCEGFTNNGVGVKNCANKSTDDARTKGYVRVNMITICANKTKARVARGCGGAGCSNKTESCTSWRVSIIVIIVIIVVIERDNSSISDSFYLS